MKFKTVTELRLEATRIVADIESTGEEVIITKKGKPVALIRPVDEEEFVLKEKEKEG